MPRLERRHLLLVALAVLAILLGRRLLAGAGEDRDAWAEVQAAGVVRVGMDASYPPFEWIDAEGQYHGYDVGLARALGEQWGLPVQFVNIHFDGLYEALVARRIDLIISALPYDELMTRDVHYSSPYLAGGQVIVAPAGSAIASEEDLRGLRVATEMGAEGHAVLNRLNRNRAMAVGVLAYPDLVQAADAVRAGQAQALVCDRIDALPLVQTGVLTVAGEPLTTEPYVIATRADSPRMAEAVQDALDALTRTGTLAELERRWLLP